MFARSIRRTSILLTLLAVLALTAGAALSVQPAVGQADVQAATDDSDASFRSGPVMLIENAGQWDKRAMPQSPSSDRSLETGTTSEWKNVELVGQVGGVTNAVVVQGNYAFVGIGPRLVILDISTPTHPTVAGQSAILPNVVQGIAVADGYAYVADGSSGLRVIRVTNPAAPVEVGFYATPSSALGVAVAGSYAYVADGSSGLRVVNVSNPAAPVEVGHYDTPGSAYGVVVAGNYAYVADGSSGLRVIRVSNPAAPVEVGFYDTPGRADGIAVAGSYAYAAAHYYGLRVIDVGNPSSPVEAGFFRTLSKALDIAVSEKRIYAVSGDIGPQDLQIVDASDPIAPVWVGATAEPYMIGWDVAVAGRYVYVAGDTDDAWGFFIINVENPADPRVVDFYRTYGEGYAVTLVGNYAYFLASDGLRIMNAANPARPYQVGFLSLGVSFGDLAVAGDYAYVADGTESLRAIAISNPTAPREVGHVSEEAWNVDNVNVAGHYAYLTTGESGLRVIDVANPAAPREFGVYSPSGWSAQYVDVTGNYAYVTGRDSTGGRGLRALDISNPLSPVEVGSADLPAYDVVVDGGYIYVGGGDSGLFILRFTGDSPTYTISGRVTDAGGAGVLGVTVWAGFPANTTTDVNGNYTFAGLSAETYNISPSRYLYAFSPSSRTVAVPPNATGQDFVQTPVVDLSVNRIEVAQVFVEQNDPISGTPIPLIAQKDTLVRVYVGVSGAPSVGGVSARLHIRQPNGTETVDSRPVNVWPVQAKQTPDPYSLQDTVNFRPPTALLQGNVTFWADVDPANRIPETNESNNTGGQVSKTFEAGESVRIAWTIMGYGSNPFTAIYPNLVTAASGDKALRRFYPVASRDVDYFFQPGIPPIVDVKFDTNEHHVLYLQKLTKFWEQVTSFHGWLGGRPDRLYGWISNEARAANGTCGAAASRYLGSWGGVAVGADHCDRSIGIVEPAVVFAHEIGHLLDATGLMHAPSSESNPRCETAPDPDPNYPTPALYPSASILAHGLDVMSSSVLWPDRTYDIMAYCKPSWVSPYNYFKLKGGFDALANHQLQTVGTAAATPQLLVSGIVYTPSLNVTFDSFYALTSTAPPSNSTGSDYCLEMRSSTGAVLVHRCFDLSFKQPESGRPINLDGFVLRMPYPSGTKQVVLTHLSTPIATRVVSAHAPTVRLLSPNGGETWTGSGTHTVTWTASDLDGDMLHFALSYSIDGGASWVPAGLDLTGTQHALDVSMLPGGTSVLLRISATDGVNTTDDVSDAPFTVGRKAPMTFILLPEDGAHFFPGAAIWLEGRAFDLEDGTLNDAALRWSSDRDGVLGTGKLVIATLSPGEHTITLTATDSDGTRATATIRLSAGDRLFLPVVLRGR